MKEYTYNEVMEYLSDKEYPHFYFFKDTKEKYSVERCERAIKFCFENQGHFKEENMYSTKEKEYFKTTTYHKWNKSTCFGQLEKE